MNHAITFSHVETCIKDELLFLFLFHLNRESKPLPNATSSILLCLECFVSYNTIPKLKFNEQDLTSSKQKTWKITGCKSVSFFASVSLATYRVELSNLNLLRVVNQSKKNRLAIANRREMVKRFT